MTATADVSSIALLIIRKKCRWVHLNFLFQVFILCSPIHSPPRGTEAPPKMLLPGYCSSLCCKRDFSARFSILCPQIPIVLLPSSAISRGDTCQPCSFHVTAHQPHHTDYVATHSMFLLALLLLSHKNVEQWVQNVYNAYST